jgi:undecaprenyl-diphosphatase
VPIVVLGLLLKDQIEGQFRRTEVIAWALILGAAALAAAEGWYTRRKSPTHLSDMTWTQGLLIGLAQTLALVPGASRSGVTITGGLLVGVSREAAARYSFLLSFPAIFGAGLYQLIKSRKELLAAEDGAANLILATVVAGLSGYVTIPFLLAVVKRYSTLVFIVYRVLLGGLLLGLLTAGVLKG